MAKIFFDYGHFNNDSGAVGNGFKEVDLNVSIGKYAVDELKRHGVDVKVGSGGSLSTRVAEANNWGCDYFVSGHVNAGGGNGFEIYVSGFGGRAEQLAKNIYSQVVDIDKLNNGRGIKQANFTVIKNTKAPAVLFEAAFIDTKDIQCIDEEHERKDFGIAIAKGILKQLGIEYIAPVNENNKNTELFYRVCLGSYKEKNNADKVLADAKAKGFNSAFITTFRK